MAFCLECTRLLLRRPNTLFERGLQFLFVYPCSILGTHSLGTHSLGTHSNYRPYIQTTAVMVNISCRIVNILEKKPFPTNIKFCKYYSRLYFNYIKQILLEKNPKYLASLLIIQLFFPTLTMNYGTECVLA